MNSASETEAKIKVLEEKAKLWRARVIAILLGSSVVFCLLCLMYAFVQQAEAVKQRELAVRTYRVALKEQDVNLSLRDSIVALNVALQKVKIGV